MAEQISEQELHELLEQGRELLQLITSQLDAIYDAHEAHPDLYYSYEGLAALACALLKRHLDSKKEL